MCLSVLSQAGMRYEPVPDRDTAPGCGFDNAVRISQSQLGVVIGCSRQTVNKMLGELRDDGIIELGRNAVRVLDPARLADGAPVPE